MERLRKLKRKLQLFLALLVLGCSHGGDLVSSSATRPTITPSATPAGVKKEKPPPLQELPKPDRENPIRPATLPGIKARRNPTTSPAPRPAAKAVPTLDLDQDGRISRAEARAARKRLDKDGNGLLDVSERAQARPLVHETNKAMRRKIMDQDHDQVVSKEEWRASWTPFDRDGDGQLSPTERDAFQANWRQRTYERGAFELLFSRKKIEP